MRSDWESLLGWPTLCGFGFAKGGLLFVRRFARGRWRRQVPGIDLHQCLAAVVEGPAAPRPADQLFSNGVGMHIVEFFEQLGAGVDVEVVVAALPETAKEILVVRKTERHLFFRTTFPCPHTAGKPLLEDLNDFGGRSGSGLGDEQMQVFGHDDVADDAEMIAGADFLENVHGERKRGAACADSSRK